MANWDKLESECYDYIVSKNYKDLKIEYFGKSDSTKADINIQQANNNDFFVEVKDSKSQCAQFVLFPDSQTCTFELSRQNKSSDSVYRQQIIDHMDQNYNNYKKVGSAGIPVDVDKTILYGWVNDFYKDKNVDFIMTKGKEFIIFPINKLPEYFDISAVYRKKPSGSGEPNPNTNIKEIEDGLKQEELPGTIVFQKIGNKNRCFLNTTQDLDKYRMVCPSYTYQFKDNRHSKKVDTNSPYVFEIRRLSNTCNPNVICELSAKKDTQNKEDLLSFENRFISGSDRQ